MTDKIASPRFSLRRKMALVVIVGVAVGLLVALLTNSVGHVVAEKLYFSDEKKQERMLAFQTDLQTFVADNGVQSVDSVQLNAWAAENNGVSLFVYKENKLILKVEPLVEEPASQEEDTTKDRFDRLYEREKDERNTEEQTTQKQRTRDTADSTETTDVIYEVFTGDPQDILTADESPVSAYSNLLLTQDSGYFEVTFADGNAVVCIRDNTENTLHEILLVISIGAAFFTLAMIVLIYNQKMVNRIVALSQTVRRIGNGEAELSIVSHGQDEIALLAREVDTMRRSVLEKSENEKKALEAGNELVATMSHDIRTPLTALMGYLDILLEHRFDDPQLEKKYLESCRSKAQQLKNLSDRLFHYFLVFGQPMAPLVPETMDAQLFLSQILGEQTQYLIEKGFQVQYVPCELNVLLCLDAHEVCRVFDNVFANVARHAECGCVVSVQTGVFSGGICVSVENTVAAHPENGESTGFGLKICERIMRQSGGSFRYEEKDGLFRAEICLPTVKEQTNTRRKKK
ncbi:MAG: HAMP domain-containing histidine kinase [Clostridia bacterium]|nr:HAMP domain-containing histidine kinase [Clostridia bacterium]